jgi:hypothetical protein
MPRYRWWGIKDLNVENTSLVVKRKSQYKKDQKYITSYYCFLSVSIENSSLCILVCESIMISSLNQLACASTLT